MPCAQVTLRRPVGHAASTQPSGGLGGLAAPEVEEGLHAPPEEDVGVAHGEEGDEGCPHGDHVEGGLLVHGHVLLVSGQHVLDDAVGHDEDAGDDVGGEEEHRVERVEAVRDAREHLELVPPDVEEEVGDLRQVAQGRQEDDELRVARAVESGGLGLRHGVVPEDHHEVVDADGCLLAGHRVEAEVRDEVADGVGQHRGPDVVHAPGRDGHAGGAHDEGVHEAYRVGGDEHGR
mmetsp:Transcript_25927/g.86905  ORF Transcript_25927/g.86905 Transcript_25927/m.86905 type:complete len:233 (+) Transcript_25927:282-980(+)